MHLLRRSVLFASILTLCLTSCSDADLAATDAPDSHQNDTIEADAGADDAGDASGYGADVASDDTAPADQADGGGEVPDSGTDPQVESTPDVAQQTDAGDTGEGHDSGAETGDGDGSDDGDDMGSSDVDGDASDGAETDLTDGGGDSGTGLDVQIEVVPVDRDGDGVSDWADNCPGLANRDQADGDDDGVGNICDNCARSYNPDQWNHDDDDLGDACDGDIPAPCTDAYNPYPVDDDASSCRGSLRLLDGRRMRYYRSYALTPPEGGRPYIRRAVIVQHGAGRTGYSYFNSMMDATVSAGSQRNTTVLAPHFQTASDLTDCGSEGECLASVPTDRGYWSSQGWKTGYDSTDGSGLPSFEVYDRIILDRLANRDWYPNLEKIVVVGHSAGGQFVQRYAVGTEVDQEASVSHLSFHYIVANPSSYVYLNDQRVDPESVTTVCDPDVSPRYTFAVPGTCSSYNDYRYGTDDVPSGHYMGQVTVADWVDNFTARRVTYLMGDEDIQQDREQTNIDTSCQAQAQGACRYDRARIFFAYMNQFFPRHDHAFVRVAGVGHTGGGMWRSPEGVETIFNVAPAP